ncbi:MAG: hypothetical protein ABIN97_19070 [Ginsengibacter sp.]
MPVRNKIYQTEASLKKVIVKHLFDFFMLFLAVTLGFFADNFRDSYLENKQTHELANNLLSDIKQDTHAISILLLHCDKKMKMLNSLYNLIDDSNVNFSDSLIYKYSAYVGERKWFERNNSTYTHLLNSGALDNFATSVATSITKYELDCEKTIAMLQNERTILSQRIIPFQDQIFHTENFHSLLDNETFMEPPELRNWNKETQWLYHN